MINYFVEEQGLLNYEVPAGGVCSRVPKVVTV